jgi:hypothetical protein
MAAALDVAAILSIARARLVRAGFTNKKPKARR